MSFTQIGSCPKCGMPIWAPLAWSGILPPPSTPTCGCFPTMLATTISNTSEAPDEEKKSMAYDVSTLANALESGGRIETKASPLAQAQAEIKDLKSELAVVKALLDKLVAVTSPTLAMPAVMSGSVEKVLLKG